MAEEATSSTRERILDAAALVMREQGLGGATVKEIAQAAGCSVALLYKYFPDQQAIYLGVLTERLGAMSVSEELPEGDERAHLAAMVEKLMAFYVRSFPMSAGIFSTPQLLRTWREGLERRGSGGPATPVRLVEQYLREHPMTGVDAEAAAALLAGAAFHAAFLACFDGLNAVPDAPGRARALVEQALGPRS